MKIIAVHLGMSLAITAEELANLPETGMTGGILTVDESDEVPPENTHKARSELFGLSLEAVVVMVAASSETVLVGGDGRIPFFGLTPGEEVQLLTPVVKKSKGERQADWKSNQNREREQSRRLAKFGR